MKIQCNIVNFKGQTPLGNAVEKAAEKAEEIYKTPADSFTKNSTEVHAAFWKTLANSTKEAAVKVVKAIKDGVNKTIEEAGDKADKKYKSPEDVYGKNHCDITFTVYKGIAKTIADAVKAPFKKEQ